MIESSAMTPEPVRVLCVDDEPSILSALRRLFRPQGWVVSVAECGQAGLDLLSVQPFDLVISDMRMPVMDGVQFLEQVRQRWPDTMRLLLTGYADIGAVMGAINRGEIYRYIAKPWDDNDIVLVVRGALEHRAMLLEQRRLQALVMRQNDELKQLNADLEGQVRARTTDLSNTLDRLKTTWVTTIKVFSGLIELRNSKMAGHSRRVADLASRLAQQMQLPAAQAQEVFVAGLLHEIGKVGFDDAMMATPVSMMRPPQLAVYRQHPTRAAQILLPLRELQGAADIIANQLERYDGAGFPSGLVGAAIPLGTRILSVASDFEGLQSGMVGQTALPAPTALRVIVEGRGRRYDPAVVDALGVLYQPTESAFDRALVESDELVLGTQQLSPGMTLSRDLVSKSGLLMLTAGHKLERATINRLMQFEQINHSPLQVSVWRRAPDEGVPSAPIA